MKLGDQWDEFSGFDDLETAELEILLQNDLKGSNVPALSIDEILYICQLIAQRKPASTNATSAWKAFWEQIISEGR